MTRVSDTLYRSQIVDIEHTLVSTIYRDADLRRLLLVLHYEGGQS